MQKINECHRKSIVFQKINYYHYYQFYYYYRQLLSIVNFCIYYNLHYGCYNLHYGCYHFHILEAAIGMCSKIYSLEANAKPTTRAKTSFIADVSRGLRPRLPTTKLSKEIGVLHIIFHLSYNLGHRNCRLYHFLAKFFFTTSGVELDYYHHRVNVRVSSRVVARIKTQDLRKLGKFEKIPEILGFDGEYPAAHPKAKF